MTEEVAEAPPRSRFYRQEGLVPELIQITPITVVGVGAIGRQVVLTLAAMGAERLEFYDFDDVDESNRATQGYPASQVGQSKVYAIQETLAWMGCSMDYMFPRHDRFRASRWEPRPAVFCCVDNMESRKAIWEGVKDRVEFFCDGRMAAENIRYLVGKPADEPGQYDASLFSDAEATPGRCTQQSTIYSAMVAAGLMCFQFSRHLRGATPDPDMLLSLADGSLAPVPREEGAAT